MLPVLQQAAEAFGIARPLRCIVLACPPKVKPRGPVAATGRLRRRLQVARGRLYQCFAIVSSLAVTWFATFFITLTPTRWTSMFL